MKRMKRTSDLKKNKVEARGEEEDERRKGKKRRRRGRREKNK